MAASIKKLVAEEIARDIAADPDAVAVLKRLGVVDDEWLSDPLTDPSGPLLRLRDLGQLVLAQPSLLLDMGVDSLDLLCCAQPEDETGVGPPTTVVFTDIEGFTSFNAEQGDTAAGDLLRAHYRVVDDIVGGRGGKVVKRLGDGHMATFDTGQAGVRAAIDLIHAAPEGLALRAGAHTGGVILLEEDVVGHTVNVASRVAAATPPGHARVTQAVVDGVGEMAGVSFGPPVEERLKGIVPPVLVREVIEP
jgi:class 3 adenylate cyclase